MLWEIGAPTGEGNSKVSSCNGNKNFTYYYIVPLLVHHYHCLDSVGTV